MYANQNLARLLATGLWIALQDFGNDHSIFTPAIFFFRALQPLHDCDILAFELDTLKKVISNRNFDQLYSFSLFHKFHEFTPYGHMDTIIG